MKIVGYLDKIIEYSFYCIFLFVPISLSSSTSELFEFNKMWLTFALSAIIGCAWTVKMILKKEFWIQKTPLDIPIILFLVSQIISTFHSLDTHVSLWGFYSRFNGGLLSIITYIFLYYAFLSNLGSVNMVKKTLLVSLVCGIFVAIWGLPSHFGYDPTCFLFRGTLDVACWTEDFQPKVRIFSTLGQPDWLAAYLAILTPIVAVFFVRPTLIFSVLNEKISKVLILKIRGISVLSMLLFLTFLLFYIDILYTKSRGSVLGLLGGLLLLVFVLGIKNGKKNSQKIIFSATALVSFASLVLLQWKSMLITQGIFIMSFVFFAIYCILVTRSSTSTIKSLWRPIAYLGISLLVISFLIGLPLQGTENFSLGKIREKLPTKQEKAKPQASNNTTQSGGTHAGEIRLIVWRGAIDVWKNNPIFGTGVESFAYSYYKHRPVEHNLTSEWDFLYNKAHNEYLNFLATTGLVGLSTYLLMIGLFIYTCIRGILAQSKYHNDLLLTISLVSAYLSILVSNFFGFSVVIVNIYFFILPAFVLILMNKIRAKNVVSLRFSMDSKQNIDFSASKSSALQWVLLLSVILFTVYLLLTLLRFWLADINYSTGYNLNRAGDYQKGYLELFEAVNKRPDEPVFRDELAQNAAVLAVALDAQKESTASGKLLDQAISLSDEVVKEHPNNIVFWKNRVRVFYALSQMDKSYLPKALNAITKAKTLAPTDAKVSYNLAVLYGQNGYTKQAIETLLETIKLKQDYYDAHYALGLFYRELAIDEKGQVIDPQSQKKAIEKMQFILDKFASDDANVLETLKSWQ